MWMVQFGFYESHKRVCVFFLKEEEEGAYDVIQLTWLAHSHQLDLGGITPLLLKSTTEEIPLHMNTHAR